MTIAAPIQTCIDTFGQRYPQLDQVSFARDQCQIKSREFAELAQDAGLDARVIRLRRQRRPTPLAGSPAPMSGEVEHLVAVIGDVAIDFTRRQFDPDAAVPTVYEPLQSIGRDWVYLNDDPHGDAPWRELPG